MDKGFAEIFYFGYKKVVFIKKNRGRLMPVPRFFVL